MRLSTRKSQLRTLPETEPKGRKRVRYGFYIYLGLMLIGLGYVGYLLFQYLFYLEVPARITLPKVLVHSKEDGYLSNVWVETGQKVELGARLVTVRLDPEEEDPYQPERLRTRRDLADLQARIANLETLVSKRRKLLSELRQVEKESMLLGVSRQEPERHLSLVREIQDLETKGKDMQAELANKKRYLAELEGLAALQVPPAVFEIRSPAKGTVTGLFGTEEEFIDRRDPLAAIIREQQKGTILAYADMEHLEWVELGKGVTVLFHNGRKVQGRIQSLKSIAGDFPDPERNGYLPLRPSIVMQVELDTELSEEAWYTLDEMFAVVRIRK